MVSVANALGVGLHAWERMLNMATRIRGRAILDIDYIETDDVNEQEAEDLFNEALKDLLLSGWDQGDGNAEYDQDHEFNVDGGLETGW